MGRFVGTLVVWPVWSLRWGFGVQVYILWFFGVTTTIRKLLSVTFVTVHKQISSPVSTVLFSIPPPACINAPGIIADREIVLLKFVCYPVIHLWGQRFSPLTPEGQRGHTVQA